MDGSFGLWLNIEAFKHCMWGQGFHFLGIKLYYGEFMCHAQGHKSVCGGAKIKIRCLIHYQNDHATPK